MPRREVEAAPGQRGGMDTNLAPKAGWDRGGDLVDTDDEHVAVPMQGAGTDLQMRGTTVDGGPLGHGPAPGPAVQRDVEGAVAERIAGAEAARPGVIGREHAADEGDQRDAVLAVVADGIDIPPDIALVRDGRVETWSAITADAANRPDRAAIGTPAPGCVPPPAR